MRINHNISALNAWRQLSLTDTALTKSLERLSSGLRINRAADDAAGLAISEKMRSQIRGLNQAIRNAQDGISLLQTAEGALNETESILQRMRELAVQSSNDTNTPEDRLKIQQEMDQLAQELSRISNTTEFNTKNLLAGFFSGTFHIGANQDQTISVSIGAMDAASLGVARDQYAARMVTGYSGAVENVTSLSSFDLEPGTYTIQAAGSVLGNAEAGSLDVGASDLRLVLQLTYGATQATTTITFAANRTYTAQEIVEAINTQAGSVVTATLENGRLRITADASGTDLAVLTGQGGSDSDVLDAAGLSSNTEQFQYRLVNESGAVVDTNYAAETARSITFHNAGLQVGLSGNQPVDMSGDAVDVYTSAASKAATLDPDGTLNPAVVLGGIDVRKQAKAEAAITRIDTAIGKVSDQRSQLGALQNRLEHTINNLGVASENLSAAESRIRDVDMAQEMMEFTRNQILIQAGTAMLAQANVKPQSVLQLLA